MRRVNRKCGISVAGNVDSKVIPSRWVAQIRIRDMLWPAEPCSPQERAGPCLQSARINISLLEKNTFKAAI